MKNPSSSPSETLSNPAPVQQIRPPASTTPPAISSGRAFPGAGFSTSPTHRRRGHTPPLHLALRLALATVALGQTLPADSLWNEKTSMSLVASKRARAVGDILTILVQESNTATKENSTSTSKKSGVDASISTFLYGPAASKFLTKGGQLPAMKLQGANNFDGGGKINNSEKITAQIAVRVVDVLPNGNLVIEGSRQTSFSGETQDAVLRGVVRGDDVQANNTVYSYNIADATIKYVSKGTVSDNTRKGWFTRVWDKVTPF